MRIVHMSDLHLGYRQGKLTNENGTNQREQDGYDAFNNIITSAIEERPDVVVIAGDLFHSAEPTVNTIKKAQEGLFRFAKENVPVYLITGNHDTGDIKSRVPATMLLDLEPLGIEAFDTPLEVVNFKSDDGEEVVFYFLSHQSLEELKETVEKLDQMIDEDAFNILVSHGGIYDKELGDILKTEGEVREVILSQDLLNRPFDLIMLGHIHTRQKIGNNIFYAGSSLRRGFSDDPGERGCVVYDIDPITKEWSERLLNVPQRAQKSFVVNLEGKTLEDAQEALKSISDEIVDWVSSRDKPIVRLVIEDASHNIKPLISLPRKAEIKDLCLSFSEQFKSINANKEILPEKQAAYTTGDLKVAFRKFVNEEVEVADEKIKEAAIEFAIACIDETIDDGR